MILENIQQAVKFLPSLNLTLDNNRFQDFFSRAQAWLVANVIGTEIEGILDTQIQAQEQAQEQAQVHVSDRHAELRTLCQRVIAEKAFEEAIPEMDMQLTEAGFAVQDNDNFSPASAQRVDRLLKQLPSRILEHADMLVQFLMAKSVNDEPYMVWRKSEQFQKLTAVFMPTVRQVRQCYGLMPIDFDYDQFLANIAYMDQKLREVADYYVSLAEINRLLGLYRGPSSTLSPVQEEAVNHLRMAAVATVKCDGRMASKECALARKVMLANSGSFTAFAASDAAKDHSINLDGGSTVNFL